MMRQFASREAPSSGDTSNCVIEILEVIDRRTDTLVRTAATISRPPDDLYRFWRDFRNLPLILENVKGVEVIDGARSRWRTLDTEGREAVRHTAITHETQNAFIGWTTGKPGHDQHSGRIQFRDLGDRKTRVQATILYDRRKRPLSQWIADLMHRGPTASACRDMCRFKQLMETGSISERSQALTKIPHTRRFRTFTDAPGWITRLDDITMRRSLRVHPCHSDTAV